MKIAVVTDLHGNLEAVETVLEVLDREGYAQIICAGDVVDPLRETRDVWQLLESRGIPILRGNHEDYTVGYHTAETHPAYLVPKFAPVRLVAESLGPEMAEKFRRLPLGLKIPGPVSQDLFICHASPLSNQRTYFDGLTPDLEAELLATGAAVIINGHRHVPWEREWRGIKLVSVGSVGIPLAGTRAAEFATFEFMQGEWRVTQRAVPYAAETTLRRYRESGWIERGGPIAWLLYDEIDTGRRGLSLFFQAMAHAGRSLAAESELREAARDFLTARGSWEKIAPLTDMQRA